MISCDVYGPFFRYVATDPQRITDRYVGTAVRDLRRPVLVRDRRFARVHRHQTLGVHVRRVRYDDRGADVVFICKPPHAGEGLRLGVVAIGESSLRGDRFPDVDAYPLRA